MIDPSGTWARTAAPLRWRRRTASAIAVALAVGLASPATAVAQQSMTEVLSFLLTNRSIATADAGLDAEAAAATRDTISRFLLIELATVPALSSSTGFTYRVEPGLGGTVVRSSDSFGPSFVDRSLTVGALRPSFGVAYQDTSFDRIDGRSLRDGTLVATASRLTGEPLPFDVETVALRVRTRTVTLTTNVGLTDRVDVSGALPFVTLTMSGQRVDTLRGTPFVQATARGRASGVGDAVLRVKYNAVRNAGSGIAIGAEARLPTGEAENLLGAGEPTLEPRIMGSLERGRLSLHSEVSYSFGGLSRELDFGGALALVGTPRLTILGEVLGRRFQSGGRIEETIAPHPTLVGVETIRLTGVPEATLRAVAVAGVKWNVAGTWLVSASVLRPLSSAGLTAAFVPSVLVEYSFAR